MSAPTVVVTSARARGGGWRPRVRARAGAAVLCAGLVATLAGCASAGAPGGGGDSVATSARAGPTAINTRPPSVPAASPVSPTTSQETSMRIRITMDGHAMGGVLHDNPAARDLATLLPLTLTLSDFHATERIGYPPRRLDTAGSPTGTAPAAGDIAYFAPWGNLALYYGNGVYDEGLVPLGRFDPGAAAVLRDLDEGVEVTLTLE